MLSFIQLPEIFLESMLSNSGYVDCLLWFGELEFPLDLTPFYKPSRQPGRTEDAFPLGSLLELFVVTLTSEQYRMLVKKKKKSPETRA